MKKEEGGTWFEFLIDCRQAMKTNRKEHTRFSCVFHPSLVRRFIVKAIKLQLLILISDMCLMVYDVYGRLVRPSALLTGSNPVIRTIGTCQKIPMPINIPVAQQFWITLKEEDEAHKLPR